MNVTALMKLAHLLAVIVIVMLLPLTYVSDEYAAGLWARINEHAQADDGLHYVEGLKEAGRALAAHASFTATILAGEANTPYFDKKIQEAATRRKHCPAGLSRRTSTVRKIRRNARCGMRSKPIGRAYPMIGRNFLRRLPCNGMIRFAGSP